MDVADFADKRPELIPEQFLSGELEGWGVLESAFGALKSRFVVKAHGTASIERRRLRRNLDVR
jgi:hypothetical protein